VSHTTFFKPARGTAKVELQARKAASRVDANRAGRLVKLEARRIEQAIRRDVYERDGGWCRACGEAVTFSGDITETMHAHHVQFRSAGGTDDPSNRLSICWSCHRDIHDHKLRVSGDPNGLIQFQLVNLETGAVLRAWESDVRE
jgi:5-methylcytosine-specific restriction endonuclease McrA